MPYRLDPTPDLLLVTLEGEVTVADLALAANAVMEAEGGYRRTPDQLIDMTGAEEFAVTFGDILARAESRRRRTLKNSIRCAILTETPVQFGLGRMYEALLDHPQIAIRVFRDRAEAHLWIRHGPEGKARQPAS